ncbi:hypothetical protein C0J52_15252 [Blattella germanica]|nr:hypothetical protein C0J52_15252 [Blattella germanica]
MLSNTCQLCSERFEWLRFLYTEILQSDLTCDYTGLVVNHSHDHTLLEMWPGELHTIRTYTASTKDYSSDLNEHHIFSLCHTSGSHVQCTKPKMEKKHFDFRIKPAAKLQHEET